MYDDTAFEVAGHALHEPDDTPLQRAYHEAINRIMAETDEIYRTMFE